MFQKKKGFTLIELLAVIVILAVIALIATPLIMNVINDAKKNSFKDSAYGIIKAVEMRVAKEQIDQIDGQNIAYKVDLTTDAIDYTGDRPTSGWAYIDVNGNVELYMCNSSFCASKAIDSNDITVTTNTSERETIAGEITRVSGLDVAELTKDGSEDESIKVTYEAPSTTDTHKGIIYLDPTDLSVKCTAEMVAANQQGQDVNGTATLTGTKSGCMKWFVFEDDGNGNPTKAILDHNTTAIAVYDFENNSSKANGRVQDKNEADYQLAQDTAAWDKRLEARFPTAQEIANAGGIPDFDVYGYQNPTYFGVNRSERGNYWWLYTNLNGVTNENGQGNDYKTYIYYTNANDETSTQSVYGYWTKTSHTRYNYVWEVRYDGYLTYNIANDTLIGVRPVISLPLANGGSGGNIPAPVDFATDSWETIIKAVKNNNTSVYNVGDTKEIELDGFGTHTLRIANKSTPSECSTAGFSQTACGFVLEFTDIISNIKWVNFSEYSDGGWRDSSARTYVNSTIYRALPTSLQEGIIDTFVVSSHNSNESANIMTEDKLYFLAMREIYGDYIYSYNYYSNDSAYDVTRQLDYYDEQGVTEDTYSSLSTQVKLYNNTVNNRQYWWTRTARSNSSASVYCVLDNGNYNGTTNPQGVSPAFRIG